MKDRKGQRKTAQRQPGKFKNAFVSPKMTPMQHPASPLLIPLVLAAFLARHSPMKTLGGGVVIWAHDLRD